MKYDARAHYRNNMELLDRDQRGNFINPVKEEDRISGMTRPLNEKENAMIEAFIKKQKELNNEIRSK